MGYRLAVKSAVNMRHDNKLVYVVRDAKHVYRQFSGVRAYNITSGDIVAIIRHDGKVVTNGKVR